MIRAALLWMFVAALGITSFRDWFRALCGLILLMAVTEHPDFPKTVLHLQGLNPWNVLLVLVIGNWAVQRGREGLRWDMPRHIAGMLLVYLGVVLVGAWRMLTNQVNLDPDATTGSLVSEHIVNCVKWVIPGLLVFDGCRTLARFKMVVACVLAIYVGLAVQVIRWMPPTALVSGADLTYLARKLLVKEVGYHAVNLSMLLAGACWAIYAARGLLVRESHRRLALVAAFVCVYGQALTGGRMGYATWAVVGLAMALLRWRRLLLGIPVVVVAVALIAPAAVDRMLQGFAGQEPDKFGMKQQAVNDYEVTSGRTLIWPYVLEKIEKEPLTGYGRLAMKRTGISARLQKELNEDFPHPHNAYLEMLLDNGVIGLALVLPFYLLMLVRSASLFRRASSGAEVAAGGMGLALILAFLVAGFGSQTFYPREGAVGMWCAIALTLRVSLERARTGAPAFSSLGNGTGRTRACPASSTSSPRATRARPYWPSSSAPTPTSAPSAS